MNFYSSIGFLLAAGVLGFGVLASGISFKVFLDLHAFLIVVGGSLAASAIAFRLDRFFGLFRVFIGRVLRGGKDDSIRNVIQELMRMAEAYRSNSPDFEQLIAKTKEPFLREAVTAAMDGIMDKKDLARLLRSRVAAMFHRYCEDATKFRIVGKYPPAFGLMGTTLGMITLLQRLGEPGGQKMIGPAMSVALVATLYGIALSNLVFSPISENLMDSAKEVRLKHTIIAEGVLLLMEKTNPIMLAEELNSYLLPNERINWRDAQGKGSTKKAA